MSKRVFIVHGWDGYPEEGWFPWLKRELEKRGFRASVPAMPEAHTPKPEAWLRHLAETVGGADAKTYFVGHSIGCQAILRYLETLPEGSRVGGAVFVAGWMQLTPLAIETPEEQAIVDTWFETPLSWNRIQRVLPISTAIFSDNDPVVPTANEATFRDKLGAEVIIEHAKGHFSGSDGITELLSALKAILKYAEHR